MSASLVGSEMCIRDSLHENVGPRHVHSAKLECIPQVRAYGRSRPDAPRTCLLYTSDAADDM
eukprot:1984553-Alexandrium_andersonii.AAC.1